MHIIRTNWAQWQKRCWKYKKLDGLSQPIIDWYAYNREEHFWTSCLWSWPLNPRPGNEHLWDVSLKYIHALLTQARKCLSMSLFDNMWSRCDLDPDLLTSKSNQFIFAPNCTDGLNCWNSDKWFTRYYVNEFQHRITDGMKSECLQHYSNGGGQA